MKGVRIFDKVTGTIGAGIQNLWVSFYTENLNEGEIINSQDQLNTKDIFWIKLIIKSILPMIKKLLILRTQKIE